MAIKGVEQVERRFVQLIAYAKNVQGQRFNEGDILEISSINAHKPGQKSIGLNNLSPLYFDFLTEEEADRLMNPENDRNEAAEDPLAGLGLE